MTVRARSRYLEQSEWLSPTNIDNTASQNVSAAITDWLATTGSDGDRYRLRNGFYFIPQGIRIGRPMRLDLNGSWLLTNQILGPEDPNLAQSLNLYPALWDDWQDVDVAGWPASRVVVRVVADDVSIFSSVANARIQGAGRKILYRASDPNLPEGIEFNSSYEGQHGIRFGYKPGGSFLTRSRLDLDLTNIAIEFVSGDGVYLMGETHDVTIHGAKQGPSVVDANTVTSGADVELGATGGLGGTINTSGAYDVWTPDLTVYPGIHHTARQGVACTFNVYDVTVRDLSIWRVGRSAIDIELAAGQMADTFTIQRVEFGHHYLGMISSGAQGSIDNFTVEDCYSYKQWQLNCHTDDPTPLRGTNWVVQRNRARFRHNSASGSPNVVDRADGLDMFDNYALVRSSGQGIDPGTSTDVVVSPAEDTQYPPASQTVVTPVAPANPVASGAALTPTIQR